MAYFVGEIIAFAGNFAPAGMMTCSGQLIPISENDVLFNLIGTTYGGDGQNTFALPDLRGRVPIYMGTGPGLPTYVEGENGGTENVTLITQQIPAHNHLAFLTQNATSANPGNSLYLADQTNTPSEPAMIYGANTMPQTLAPQSVSQTGGSQPHENRQPFLAITYCIAMFGIFPSQN